MYELWKLGVVFLLALGAQGQTGRPLAPPNRLEWNVPVTGPEGSHLNWFEMKVDPENGDNLIICGAARNARDNAYYGVVYASRDGGRNWEKTLEDRSSTWVSEQSCAFGRRHRAYFISEASQVTDGQLSHRRGTTRIFVSADSGRTWTEKAKTGWADYSSSTVATEPGTDARRLYVFYNGNSEYDAAKKFGNTIEFFTASEDGTIVSGRNTVPGIADRNYQGIYPSSSVTLNDGSPVVLYNGRRKSTTADGLVFLDLGVVRFTATGAPISTLITTHQLRDDPPICPLNISTSLAYDRTHEALYVAYPDVTPGYCAVMLTKSADGGRTWSTPHQLTIAGESRSTIYFPILTVSQDGVLGLQWRGKPEGSPDCWFFSTSRDESNLDSTVPLTECVAANTFDNQSSIYLTTVVSPPRAGQSFSVDVLTFRDYLTRIGINTTPDGAFHPVWSTLGEGRGELRTAKIQSERTSTLSPSELIDATQLSEVTDALVLVYGGKQQLDQSSDTVSLDLSFRNVTNRQFRTPLFVKIENPQSDFGTLELTGYPPVTSLGKNYIDVSGSLHQGSLAPNETSTPLNLTFHFAGHDSPLLRKYFVLRLKLRFFSVRR